MITIGRKQRETWQEAIMKVADAIDEIVLSAVRAEREACAKIAERHGEAADDLPDRKWSDGWKSSSASIAYDIRNRT